MRSFLFGIAVALQAVQSPQTARHAAPDSAAVFERVHYAESTFVATWRRAWEATMDEARRPGVSHSLPPFHDTTAKYVADSLLSRALLARFFPLLCLQIANQEWWNRPWSPRDVRNEFGPRGVCPIWTPRDAGETHDVSIFLDSALSESRRPEIARSRDSVLSTLQAAAAQFPSNAFLTGQRVRFLIDANALDRALDVARACSTNRWWCSVLAGLALHRSGRSREADSAFSVAYAATAGQARCEWTDIGGLLDSATLANYRKLSCAQRDSLSATFWWLSDPLWSEAGNERRAEHFARKVSVMLRSALPEDELYHWLPLKGGGAVASMAIRYGWPSNVYWRGTEYDKGITGWYVNNEESRRIWRRDVSRDSAPPYTTAEYSMDRIHTVPAWSAVRSPFRAQSTDWELSGIGDGPGDTTFLGPKTEFLGPQWWPIEHFRPSHPIVQFRTEQRAQFPRDSGMLIAYATDLRPLTLHRPTGDSVHATLWWTPTPSVVQSMSQNSGVVGSTLVARGEVPSVDAMIGIEAPGTGTIPAARARFGVTAIPSLSTLHGAFAISNPVLLNGDPSSVSARDASATDPLSAMRGNAFVDRGSRVGVYWETYGINRTDSVDVAVWIERYTPQSTARRLGNLLGLAADLNTPVVVRWTEPDASHATLSIASQVPILARALTIDVSALPTGQYWLDVAVAKRGQQPVHGRREFTIR